jgi:hypothetical protein
MIVTPFYLLSTVCFRRQLMGMSMSSMSQLGIPVCVTVRFLCELHSTVRVHASRTNSFCHRLLAQIALECAKTVRLQSEGAVRTVDERSCRVFDALLRDGSGEGACHACWRSICGDELWWYRLRLLDCVA